MEIKTKTCSLCGEMKPLTEYYKHSSTKDGYRGFCKTCYCEKTNKYYRANQEAYRDLRRAWVEKNKERHQKRSRDYWLQNKDARNAYRREWVNLNHDRVMETRRRFKERNKGKLLDQSRKWRAKNSDKIRVVHQRRRTAKGSHTVEQIRTLMLKQKYKCAICKKSVRNSYHIDHITPLKRGGSNDIENIQILCPTCNLQKGAKDPVEFMQSRGFLL